MKKCIKIVSNYIELKSILYLLLTFMLIICAGVCTALAPLILKKIIDTLSIHLYQSSLIYLFMTYSIILILERVFNESQFMSYPHWENSVLKNAYAHIFESLFHIDPDFFKNRLYGTITSQIYQAISGLEHYFYKKLKNETENYVRLKLCELLKYLSVAYNTYGNIPFNDELDEIWHLWILQTIQYQELMDKLPVKKFIHHSSNDYDDGKLIDTGEEEANRQFSFLVSYVQNFGDFTEEASKFWPMVNQLKTIMDLDLVGLNQFLRETAQKVKVDML